MGQEIFVMTEQKDRTIEEVSFFLISEGKRLQEKLGGSYNLSAIVVGYGIRNLEVELGSYGAHQVYYFDHPLLERYHPELYTDLIAQLVKEKGPDIFLLGATPLGSDLAPRIAARLRGELVTNCVDLLVHRNKLQVIKVVSNGYLYQKVIFRNQGVKMVTLSSDALTKDDPDPTRKGEVVSIHPVLDETRIRIRFLESVKGDPKTIPLEEADLIVCGGRGVGREAFGMIHELADALNGSVGGTRPVIDWGILPYERQIGQTGTDVSPSMLLTCAVSGANEFMAGIESSKNVIAINIDRRARIFKFSDLSIIGDVHEIIPLVIGLIKRMSRNGEEVSAPDR